MRRRVQSRALATFVAVVTVGCVLPDVDLEGRRCPCAEGWVCDPTAGVCVRSLGLLDAGGTDSGGVDVDAGASLDGGLDAGDVARDADPPDAAASDGGVVETDASDCTLGTFGGHEYASCSSAVSWNDAAARCSALGMLLAAINDAEEEAFVLEFRASESTWLGGADTEVEGEWRWPNGELFFRGDRNGMAVDMALERWGMNEPGGGAFENCLLLNRNAAWVDYRCDGAFPFLCESR